MKFIAQWFKWRTECVACEEFKSFGFGLSLDVYLMKGCHFIFPAILRSDRN